jgi:GT2 family glycosyltransferase
MGPDSRMMPDLSVIVVYFRETDELRTCLNSLGGACPGLTLELYVVDNSTTQELTTDILEGHHSARLIQSGRNLGLARATNLALETARGRYYLCLNPDVIAGARSAAKLVEYADNHPKTGIVAAKLTNPDGTLQYSCRRFYSLAHILVRRTFFRSFLPAEQIDADHLMHDFDHDAPADVDWVLGSCLLVRAEAVRDVGPMDPRFFLYFEDVDWCYRMHQAGWNVVYYPGAVMVHAHRRESASRGLGRQKRAHMRSFIQFHMKHGWGLLLRRNR